VPGQNPSSVFYKVTPRLVRRDVEEQIEEDSASGGPIAAILETFENPHSKRDYLIETICP
jgi:hypothetical protein